MINKRESFEHNPEGEAEETTASVESEQPSDRSDFFSEIQTAQERVRLIKEEVGLFLGTEEMSSEKARDLLDKISEMQAALSYLDGFFDEQSFDQRIVGEYFYEDVAEIFSERLFLRQAVKSMDSQLSRLKRELEGILLELSRIEIGEKGAEAELKKGAEGEEKARHEIMDGIQKTRKSLSGIFGRFKKNTEPDMLGKLDALERAVRERLDDLPLFLDKQLNDSARRYKETRLALGKNERESMRLDKEKDRELGKIKGKIIERLEGLSSQLQGVARALEGLDGKAKNEATMRDFFEGVVVPMLNLADQGQESDPKDVERDTVFPAKESLTNIRETVSCFVRYFYRHRDWDQKQMTELIQEELGRVRQNRFIGIGQSDDGFSVFLQEGKLKCIWELPEKERVGKVRTLSRSDARRALEDRAKTEEELGVSGQNPISGFLGSKNNRDEKAGPQQYGKYVIILKDEALNRSLFTEGDSLNPSFLVDPLSAKREKPVRARALLPEHALISKALFNLMRYHPETQTYYFPDSDPNSRQEYIEAQILGGVRLEDVKEIVVEDISSVDPELKQIIEQKGIPLRSEVSFES